MTELFEQCEVGVPSLADGEQWPRVISKNVDTELEADLEAGSQS